MTPIVIVPGLGGSGETHWQTHLQRSLPNATRVQQDDWERPELTRWMERLARTVETRPDAILVAHSLGCPLVAHLARQRPDLLIKGELLVAPADVDSAHHTPRNPRLCPDSTPSASVPKYRRGEHQRPLYITIGRAHELATAWGADFVNAGAVGHINVEAGFGPWTRGRAYGRFPNGMG
jgi:predicted alpha/beta hydrolase family esterase